YFGAWGTHSGLAYSMNERTVIRAAYARSFSELMSVTGSTHNMGFTLTQTFPNTTNGVQPTYLVKNGMPAWVAPPFVNPSVSNGANVSWWQGKETTRPPETNNFTFSIQRQLSRSMFVEASYNGVIGSHLQTQLLNYNQVPMNYATAFGSISQSTTILNSAIGSAAANSAGIFAPY